MKRIALATVLVIVAVLVIWSTVKTYKENLAIQDQEANFAVERSKYPFILLNINPWGTDYADQAKSGKGSVSIVTVYFDDQHSQGYGIFNATRNVYNYSCKEKYYTLYSSELMDRQGGSISVIPINSDHRFSSSDVTTHYILAYACKNISIGPGLKNIARVMQHGRSLAPDPLRAPPL